ncbi:Ankyrin-2 [Lachnellula suecica]|uniref:Ankyrin-2 n=1 Tax=Lachnellula suecica TaxID=602035 RepID=A0A8T9CAJ0_9HELO|nr:Ankyrin-2 [Lachnellula suecica]
MPAVRTAYRVVGLPPDTELETADRYLAYDPEQNVELIPKSIGSLNNSDPQHSKIATVYFNYRDVRADKLPSLKGRSREGVVVDKDFFGFTPMNTPQTPIIADIVAVTGLAANAYGSWASDLEHMWLRDMLPMDIPNARILIYGYDSHLEASQSYSGLSGFSTPFARALDDIRAHDPERPLILIGHSLGGLVIQKVFALLLLEREMKCPPIPLMISLGVPHRGLDNKALETLVSNSPTSKLVTELGLESPTLADHLDDFIHFISNQKETHILSVYEQRLTASVVVKEDGSWERSGPPIKMVPEGSAVIGLGGGQETKFPSQTDHSQLAKLPYRTESIYPQIKAGIQRALGGTVTGHQQLFAAIEGHDFERLKSLATSRNFDVNPLDQNGKRALVLAAKWGSKDAVEVLLQANADPNLHDGAGWTPLTMAAKHEAPIDVVRLLLEYRASVDIRGGPKGCTPLHLAAYCANSNIVQTLLASGARTEVKDDDGRTPLYIASRQKCNSNVRVLLGSVGIDVNSCNWKPDDRKYGETPLMAAAYCDVDPQNCLKVLNSLVTHNADVNIQTQIIAESALMIASSWGNCPGVAYLLKNGAKTELRNKEQWTALIYAAQKGRLDVVKELIESGNANISAECSRQWRAFDWAYHHGHKYLVEYFLEIDASYRPRSTFANDVDRSKVEGIREIMERLPPPLGLERQEPGGFMRFLRGRHR